ncbi:MAG TPA: DUF308 domain-containing protein [Methanoregulaceae archaeon]|nr:DUF308 domain-containing protein [Methanoregulaceae archaeon]
MSDETVVTSAAGAFSKSPGWLRALEVIAGIILILIAFYVWVYPGIATLTYVYIFGIALIIIGFARFIAGFVAKNLTTGIRILMIIVGILAVAIGFYAIAYPLVGAITMVYFFAFAMLFLGFDRLALAGTAGAAEEANWLKYLSIIVGVFSIIISFVILLYPGFGLALIFVLISLQLFLLGIELIAAGITGLSLLKF